jgi:putative cell wall-binding protein
VSAAVEALLTHYTVGNVSRLAGPDRFSASADISANNFPANADTVYVASGMNFPDALSGAPVAGRDFNPILLVPPTSIPASIAAEITRLNPATIVILGGPNSVSRDVQQQLASYLR